MTGAALDHRLIMFIGPPGAGKSTLSRWLYEQLTHRGVPTTLLTEEEVYQLDALQTFTEEWDRCDSGAIDTLLDAVRTLCGEWNTSGNVWITDQFLPAVHWLQGKYPPDHVQAYVEALAPILAPLHPFLVSLESDVHEAWQRAVAERGQNWSGWMVEVFRSRDFPQYSGGPIQDLDELLRYFAAGQSQSRALLARWSAETLVLDTIATPLNQLKDTLLQHLGLS